MDSADSGFEIEEIRRRYQKRFAKPTQDPRLELFQRFALEERDREISSFLADHFGKLGGRTVLEVGAGSGGNIPSLLRIGFVQRNVYANELLSERAQSLPNLIPIGNVHVGDIRSFAPPNQFDVVFASTVFTSVLSANLRRSMADHIWQLVRPGGLILWYDFKLEMPWNRETRGISLSEVKSLFPCASTSDARSMTLFRPIGKRVGRFYKVFNFRLLRSHLLVKLEKPHQ